MLDSLIKADPSATDEKRIDAIVGISGAERFSN